MKQQHADYQVVAYRSAQHEPMIHGLLEVDVTKARAGRHWREAGGR